MPMQKKTAKKKDIADWGQGVKKAVESFGGAAKPKPKSQVKPVYKSSGPHPSVRRNLQGQATRGTGIYGMPSKKK